MSESARFTRRIEDFTCGQCGREINGTGYTNHCPACLWSRHVDVLPGDRAADCGGMMEPIGVLYEGGEYLVAQRCVVCGRLWRNRCAVNDSRTAIQSLAGTPVPSPRTNPRPGSR